MSGSFTVYPAIDLMGGRVVRLRQGDPERRTTYAHSAGEFAEELSQAGATWLHVVDLDEAFGRRTSENKRAIARVLELEGLNIQLAGGFRSLEAIASALELGAARLVLGTMAVEQPESLDEAVSHFGAESLAVAVDARDGRLRSHGWTIGSKLTVDDFCRDLVEIGVATVIYTDTERDGTGAGLSLAKAQAIQETTGMAVIVSGGVASTADVTAARQAGLAGAVVGKALHDGRIPMQELFRC